jgi:cell division protein FtsQ
MAISQKVEPRTRTQSGGGRAPVRGTKARARRAASDGQSFTLADVFRSIRVYGRPVAFVCALFAMVVVYYLFTSSSVFALKGIEVSEASQGVRAEVEQIVRRTVGQSRLLDVDLASIRQKVEGLPRVREAIVARILPDKVHVQVIEREPAVLVRRNSGLLVWLDREAVEIGEFATKPGDTKKIPPTATGFAEGTLTAGALAENRERVAIYKKIEQEFTSEDSLWDMVDEIDLSSPKYVNLQLLNSPAHVVLGNDDFKTRFKIALQVLQAVKERDAEQLSRLRVQDAERLIDNADRINFLDASKLGHIVFAFSSPKTENKPDAGTLKKADIAKPSAPPAAKPIAAKAEKKKAEVRKVAAKTETRKAVKASVSKPVTAKASRALPAATSKGKSSNKQAPGKKK